MVVRSSDPIAASDLQKPGPARQEQVFSGSGAQVQPLPGAPQVSVCAPELS